MMRERKNDRRTEWAKEFVGYQGLTAGGEMGLILLGVSLSYALLRIAGVI